MCIRDRNETLERIMQTEWDKLGPVKFDKADIDFANEIRSTFTETEILDSFQRIGIKAPLDLPLCDFVASLDSSNNGGIGSTDVGDVSWVVPTVQARVATCAVGTPFHTWQTVAQGKSAAAHKGMIHAAKIMASTASILIKNPEKIVEAKKEFDNQISKNPYVCPIPEGVNPPISKD